MISEYVKSPLEICIIISNFRTFHSGGGSQGLDRLGGWIEKCLSEYFISCLEQGGITCGAIDKPRKSSEAIDERVIINFHDKNVVIARFCDKNVYR